MKILHDTCYFNFFVCVFSFFKRKNYNVTAKYEMCDKNKSTQVYFYTGAGILISFPFATDYRTRYATLKKYYSNKYASA
jgi:hypothetical protein